jgi:nitrite reductase/ring-hydroxylating ferredoxin subunit
MAGEVAFRWSGEVMEPSDGLPYLGRNPLDNEHVYQITGDSGNGMTHATAGAILVADLIADRPNSWKELFDPARKAVHGLGDFFKEQANTLSQYADWVKSGDTLHPDQIAPGQCGLVRDGAALLAVYRHEDGRLQALSAACTHLGYAVPWNSAERSWDCPCHGSRFGIDGAVLHGSAPTPLAPKPLPR